MAFSPIIPPGSSSGVKLRLEARSGNTRAALYEPGESGFLIGSVPGCDMRLPGVNLPPVIALVAKHPGGATLRKLAPILPISVNGRPVASAELANGDTISLGSVELVVHMEVFAPPPADFSPERDAREQALARRCAELEAAIRRTPPNLSRREQELARQEQELAAMRQELVQLRAQFADRFQERRDKLLSRQQGVLRAASKLKARKRQLERRETEILAHSEDAARARAEADALSERADQQLAEIEQRNSELDARQSQAEQLEQSIATAQAALDAAQRKNQSDLIRFDRIQTALDLRQRQLDQREVEINERHAQLDDERRAAEEYRRQMDEWHERLAEDAQKLDSRNADADQRDAELNRRAGTLEGQQQTLATLRGRLEKLRDELREQEQILADQRIMHEASETDLRTRIEEAQRFRAEAVAEREASAQERRQFDDRRTMLEQATAQLREARDAVANDQNALELRAQEVESLLADQRQQAEVLLKRGMQLEQLANRISNDQQSFREREAALARSDASLTAQRQQLDVRAEELAERERRLLAGESEIERLRKIAEDDVRSDRQQNQQARTELEQLHTELIAQANTLENRERELIAREKTLAERMERLIEEARTLNGQRQAVASERRTWESERQVTVEQDRQTRDELAGMIEQLPALETRISAGLDRLVRAREQIKEIETAARQGREELQAARDQVAAEAERIRLAELDLGVARDEHRHAVEAFRTQLLDWQTQLSSLRQQSPVQSTAIPGGSHASAPYLPETPIATDAIPGGSHASAPYLPETPIATDTQDWYRRKLREQDEEPATSAYPVGQLQPDADKQLSELLGSLNLIDSQTLEKVLAESRRRRCSLRQLLLAEGYLSLYQMALIEAGNLDGLKLGPVRVIGKVPSTPRESVYRVFDPRRSVEGVLRHLSESEMADSIRPVEFRSRFRAAIAVKHANIASVIEVLEISGRPAALLEGVSGLSSNDWPGLAAAPGAWYRLVCQAALGLHAIHDSGLTHGHLDSSSFVLTVDGTLKLIGLGEPLWLTTNHTPSTEPLPAADLAALGQVSETWAVTPPGSNTVKLKPLPEELQRLVVRMKSGEFYTAKALIEELERIGVRVPASGAAWQRLLQYVSQQSETKEAA